MCFSGWISHEDRVPQLRKEALIKDYWYDDAELGLPHRPAPPLSAEGDSLHDPARRRG